MYISFASLCSCLYSFAAFLDTMRTLSHYSFPGQMPPNMKSAAAAAVTGKKRVREEEQAAAVNKQEFGKAWSV
jgi:hypothetical protein